MNCCELCNTHYLHEPEHCFEVKFPCHSPAKDQTANYVDSRTPEEVEAGRKLQEAAVYTESVSGEHERFVQENIMDVSGEEWEVRFDRNFKHVHHPLIQAENVIHDTKPLKDFFRALLKKEYERGREEVLDEVEKIIQGEFLYEDNWELYKRIAVRLKALKGDI